MKATEQYFHVVLFNMLYKVVSTFEPIDEAIVPCHLIKSSSVHCMSGSEINFFMLAPTGNLTKIFSAR